MGGHRSPAFRQLLEERADRRLGPYRLEKELGRGGFAPVWLATEMYGETELRTVAIKLFALGDDGPTSSGTRDSSRSSTAKLQRDRIIEEARALCRVEHPNVVRFYALTTDATASVLGLVMEYLTGDSLEKRLEAKGRLGVSEVLAVGAAIASALAAAHQAGLIHRDIKPANVLENVGLYKLIDFGIAAADVDKMPPREGEKAAVSKAKQVVVIDDLPLENRGPELADIAPSGSGSVAHGAGTVGYIDPASLDAEATPSSDLYSLGVTLFELATGSLPAVAAARTEGTSGLKGEVLDGRTRSPSLRNYAPDAPDALVKLVDLLLDPDPSHRPRSAEAVAWEIERIRLTLAGRARALPPESIGPFRGLGRFEGDDRDIFFGRSSEVAACLELLRQRGLVALVGPSGSGKSSLGRAGVLPAVADGQLGGWPKTWDTVVLTPGSDPKSAIVSALAPFIPDAAKKTPDSLAAALAERAHSSGRGVLLMVDQLEELVALSSGDSQSYAVAMLARIGAQPTAGLRCLCAARRDLLDPLLALGDLGQVLTRGTQLVSPMRDSIWGEVLDQALGAYGYRLEDDAMRVELLAQLKDTADAMPLVQFALTKLWERRDPEKKILPRAALEAIGGIGGALEMHAEAKVVALVRHGSDALDAARDLLLELTTPQGTRQQRRRRELLASSAHAIAPVVLEELEKARLVVAEEEGLTLAHEMLLVRWKRLESWIAEAREDRLLAEDVERDARAWQTQSRPEERVWRKRRLYAASDLARKGTVKLDVTAREFIAAGRALERRGKVVAIGGAAILAAIGVVAGAFYVHARRTNEAALHQALRQAQDERAHAEATKVEAQQASARAEEAQKQAEELALLIAEKSKALTTESSSRAQAVEELRALQARAIGGATRPGIVAPSPQPALTPVVAEPAPAGTKRKDRIVVP